MTKKKCVLLVIDSLGVGAAPDAKEYGDENANTFRNVSKSVGPLRLPTFDKLGFGQMTDIAGVPSMQFFKCCRKTCRKIIRQRFNNRPLGNCRTCDQ